MEGKRVRVLLVDNDKNDYILIRGLLSQAPGSAYELRWAPDYETALLAIRQREDDVVLLDYRLGGRDGLELLRAAGGRDHEAPIIILTGAGSYEVDVETMLAGASDCVVKGECGAVMLDRVVRHAIERKRAGGDPRRGAPSLCEGPDVRAAGPAAAAVGLQILLVEDNPVNQKLMQRTLEHLGHRVVTAHNGLEALGCHEQGRFDVILMDVSMPVMDGLRATAAIREREKAVWAHTPIIGVTAFGLASDRERCLRAGMDDYLAKPVRAVDLQRALERWGADGTRAA